MSDSKLYALLVGINKYKANKEFRNLVACVNDVNIMKSILEEKYPAENRIIKTLTNENATKHNIIEGFEKHLSQAGPNDFLLFYYSGHGATEKTPDEFLPYNPSFQMENIVCHDSRTGDVFDLADKEIAYLLHKASAQNPKVVVIMDCCHSGSGTRSQKEEGEDGEGETVSQVNVRNGDMNKKTRPGTAFYGYEKVTDFAPPASNHLLLSACRNHQKAKEALIGGSLRGVFSYCLTKALKENPDINYVDLFKKAESLVAIEGFEQQPQFQTVGLVDPFNGFLSTKRNIGEQILPLVKEGSDENARWYINKGYLSLKHFDFSQTGHGLKLGIYEQRAEVSEENLVAEASSMSIGQNKTYIDVPRSIAKSHKRYKAAILSFPAAPFLIRSEGADQDLLAALEKNIQENTDLLVRFTDGKEKTKYKVVANDGQLELHHSDYGMLLQGAKGVQREVVKHITKQIEKVVNWHWLLDFQNPDYTNNWLPTAHLQQEDVVEFRPDKVDFWLDIDGFGQLRAEDPLLTLELGKEELIRIGSSVKNNTGGYIQVTHAFMDQAYYIKLWRHEFEASQQLAFLKQTQPFKMEGLWEEEFLHFKIIVSKDPFPEIIKEQKPIKIGEIVEFNRDFGPSRGMVETDSALTWFSKTISVCLRKK